MLYLLMKESDRMKNDIDYSLIGERIREARKKKGWSQEKLAEEIDIATAFLSRVERGHSQINLKRLSQIANALDVPMETLITGVITSSDKYLDKELYKVLIKCTPDKQKLIYNIAKAVSESNPANLDLKIDTKF